MMGLCEFCWNFFSEGLTEVNSKTRSGGIVVWYICESCSKNPHIDFYVRGFVENLLA